MAPQSQGFQIHSPSRDVSFWQLSAEVVDAKNNQSVLPSFPSMLNYFGWDAEESGGKAYVVSSGHSSLAVRETRRNLGFGPRSSPSPITDIGMLAFVLPQLILPNCHDSSQILAVKAALHLSVVSTTVICREEELKKVLEFCKMCIEKKKVGSMYVCGYPRTGKSLLLEKVNFLSIEWAKEVGMPPPTSMIVNCTSLTNTSDIFSKILEQCQRNKKCSINSSPFQELKSFLCEGKQSSVKK